MDDLTYEPTRSRVLAPDGTHLGDVSVAWDGRFVAEPAEEPHSTASFPARVKALSVMRTPYPTREAAGAALWRLAQETATPSPVQTPPDAPQEP